MKSVAKLVVIALVAVAPVSARAQVWTRQSLVPQSASSGSFSHTEAALVNNRARTFGNTVSGSGTRYYAVGDADLRGKSSAEILKLLSPPEIQVTTGLRRVDIVIDVRRPIIVRVAGGETVGIGTTTLNGSALRNVAVRASIFSSNVTVERR